MPSGAPHPFIALEGTDGSGKSTLRKILHDELNAAGHGCFMIGQHSWLDVAAGRVVLAARTQRNGIGRTELTRAYARDKLLHLRRNVLPALETVAVIADRFIYSDAVYHQVLYGIPAEETLAHHRVLGTVQPDIVVFVDTDPDVAYERAVSRGMSLRAHENRDTLRLLHRGYQAVLTEEALGADGPRIIRLDNNGPDPAATAQALAESLRSLFRRGEVVAGG